MSLSLRHKAQWLLLLASLLLTLLFFEGALRLYLAYAKSDFLGIRDPNLYTGGQNEDDYWYYMRRWRGDLFAGSKGRAGAAWEFYDHWNESLQFDPVLGYRRKPGVTIPGVETSNLGTRGRKRYKAQGKKIVFYGDSWVESNAPSDDTLPAKIERKTGIDCLNYGVGGYGLDQIYILFDQTHRQFDAQQSVFLVGVIGEDLERMLLKVRQTAKPYFEIQNGGLSLRTEHIDPVDPRKFFKTHKPRMLSFLLNLLAKKIAPINNLLIARRERQELAKMQALLALLLEKFRQSRVRLTFVVFSDLRNNLLKTELQRQKIPFIEADRCIQEAIDRSKIAGPCLFPAGHPSQKLNESIADCIIAKLGLAS